MPNVPAPRLAPRLKICKEAMLYNRVLGSFGDHAGVTTSHR